MNYYTLGIFILLVLCLFICRHYHFRHLTTERWLHQTIARFTGAIGASCFIYLGYVFFNPETTIPARNGIMHHTGIIEIKGTTFYTGVLTFDGSEYPEGPITIKTEDGEFQLDVFNTRPMPAENISVRYKGDKYFCFTSIVDAACYPAEIR